MGVDSYDVLLPSNKTIDEHARMVGKNKVRVFIAIILLLSIIWGISCAPSHIQGRTNILGLFSRFRVHGSRLKGKADAI